MKEEEAADIAAKAKLEAVIMESLEPIIREGSPSKEFEDWSRWGAIQAIRMLLSALRVERVADGK